jgi:hypothetical protein
MRFYRSTDLSKPNSKNGASLNSELQFEGDRLLVQDNNDYEDREVTDDEGRELRRGEAPSG